MELRFLVVFVVVVSCVDSCMGGEKVVDPVYSSWAKHPIGSKVIRTWTSTQPGGNVTIVTETQTLRQVLDDKVVVSAEYVSMSTGSVPFGTRPKDTEIPRLVDLPPGTKKEDFTLRLPGAIEEGKAHERVLVTAGGFQCRWYKTRKEVQGNSIEAKTWICEDVPGRLVRSDEMKTKDGKLLSTTVRELIEFKKP